MMRRLGVSLYPDHSDFEEDKKYLELAAENGFSRIFMSMLEVTEGKEVVFKKFKQVIDFAKKLEFEVILDIAPAIFEALEISYDDLSFFSEVGADGIRLDLGFDGNKEALLSFNPYDLIIELNMSNDVAYLDNILTYEANKPFIYGCHNFYPQDGSALPLDFFIKCSERFKKHGLRTAAFITSQTAELGPWDINDGLPTVEMHRRLPIDVQAKHLFATGLIDDVIIGNAYATEEELVSLSQVNRYQVSLTVDLVADINEVEKNILFDNQHVRRGDITAQMVRSTEVRKKYKQEENPLHDNELVFQRGDIVIGNDTFGKYKNELQIVLEPHSDNRKNKVGQIRKEELILLDYIKPWSKFVFSQK
ncbi:DUF871 domain-containing protein [Vagococcus elongatus]|uniref:PTS-associated protein n=1 Tax=Vagococcus elongatus TaxID=180344 RepID=A0A430AZQ0_9ENTE|nr:MupG family TIM beta-alpha barrel fold protein [Vagococcus elongatus]RSU13573.1 hypothetical protein CBF29_04790 [Vagococcus elongatus]